MWAKKAGGVGTDNAESIALSNVKYPVDAPYRDVYITGTIQVAPLAVSLHLILGHLFGKRCVISDRTALHLDFSYFAGQGVVRYNKDCECALQYDQISLHCEV